MLPHDGRGPGVLEEGHRSFLAGAAIDGPSERRLPAAVFSTACRARDVASDTLCRAPPRRDRSLAAPESQVCFPPHLVKNEGCPHTRAPSIDEYSLHPACARDHEEPATVLTALPPRAGFRRSFASCAHSRGHPFEAERLDPDALERGPSAARRLLQSNNPRARLLDRLNPDQRPRKLPPGCASREAPPMVLTRWRRSRRSSELVTRLSLEAIPAEESRARGWRGFRLPAPLAAIARDESFAPTRSARTPPVVISWRRRLERPVSPDTRAGRGSATSSPSEPADADPP
jgi:hypothetical protein